MQINIPTEKLAGNGKKLINRISDLKKLPRWVILTAILVSVLLIGLIIYLKWPKPAPPVYPTVQAEPLMVEDVEIYVEYAGKIKARQHVEIRARVEGYLERMFFEEGGYVEKNELLYSIDPKLYRARVEKASAQLKKDKALMQKAERDLQRIRPLYEQNAASQLDLDNAIAAYEAAQAEVVMSEADLAQAEIALSYTEVRSPISGFISESSADIGTLVGPGGKSLLATVVNSDTVEVNFSMTGLDYLKSKERNVNLGKRIEDRKWNPYVTITIADNREYPIKGMVDFADPKVDPNTGTFSVRAQMPNPDHILLPGQLTKVRLLMDVYENAIVIPSKALVIEKGGAYVFVLRKDDIVEKRFVELGPEVANKFVIERGLGADEMIIVEGFHKLSHGMRVDPVEDIEYEK
ncbi:MAG: efflux RND transporter periplasmic adaptor subunit [Bacteroidales bacterium]|nr:efflux RND transporter periplasmic adaptor subunit [Bacteroidales bacterium]